MDTGLVSLGLVNAFLDTKEFIANSKTVKILPVHLMEFVSVFNASVILVGRETTVRCHQWLQKLRDVPLLALDLIMESVLMSLHQHHPTNLILPLFTTKDFGSVHVNLDGLELIVQKQRSNNQQRSIVQMELTMIMMD